ncbi:MAG: hypothetical protein JSU94_11785 [Phycisphaerales bacterium]|nr:MAG: hypothetical protein JSU94_11785 [Phycisphaerales bacterium]
MNGLKKTAMCMTMLAPVFVGFVVVAAPSSERCGSSVDANTIKKKDYEAARATPQPIDLWKIEGDRFRANKRTSAELRKMKTYGYPIELVCPMIQGAAKYVVEIKGVRGCGEMLTVEGEGNCFVFDEKALPPGRYQWAAAAYTKEGQCLGDVEVIEPVMVFRVTGSEPPVRTGKQALLDLRHSNGFIRGWGYYTYGQYMMKDLLERAGFEVYVNERDMLTAQMLKGIDLMIVNYYWTGWTDFRSYAESELSAIADFVSGGGSLLVAGCDKPGGGKMIQAGNRLVEQFGLRFMLLDSAKYPVKVENVDDLGVIAFDNPLLLQLPVAVEGRGYPLLAFEDTPVAAAVQYGNGRIIVAGVGMSFLDCYLGDCQSREPFHMLLFYDFIRYLTGVDWTMHCEEQSVRQVVQRCPSLRLREYGDT